MTQKLRILVADDEPDMREYFVRILPRLGHQVVAVARTGHELVDLCHEHRPDLVITDIRMPGLDGIEAARLILQEHNIPLILVSACHDSMTNECAETDHHMCFLVKPVRQSELASAIALARLTFSDRQDPPKPADIPAD